MLIATHPTGLQALLPVINAVPAALLVFDAEGLITEANALACDCLGRPRESLLGFFVADFDDQLNLSEARQAWARMGAGETITSMGNYVGAAGKSVVLEMRCGWVPAPGARSYLAVLQDVTQSQSLRNLVLMNEERLAQAAKAAQFGVFSDNLANGQVHWSGEFRNIVGHPVDAPALATSDVAGLIHSDDREIVLMALRRAQDPASDGKFDSIHRVIRRSDGALRWVQLIGNVVFEGAGPQRHAIEVNGMLHDISDRVLAKQDLMASRKRYELALDASPISLFEQDLALRYTWFCNSSLGYLPEEMLGRTDRDLMSAEAAEALMALRREVLQTGEPLRQLVAITRRDGSIAQIDLTIRARRDSAGKVVGLTGTGLDVTESHQVRSRLEASNVAMKLRNMEVESVNQIRARFMSTLSHELRTPLHTLQGYLRLAMQSSEGETLEFLRIVERSGRQLLKQIGDLLSFNRMDKQLGTLQPTTVEWLPMLEQIERTARILAQHGGNKFRLQLTGKMPKWVRVDEYRLMQVLDNLLSNASKFTRHGQITLDVAGTEEHADGAERWRVRVFVQDTGVGMTEKDLGRIFDPFVKLDSHKFASGLGLGLTIARQWVAAMGGNLQVESVPAQGSRFYFELELPVVSEESMPAGLCQLHATPGKDPAHRLLVVDDDAQSRHLLAHVCGDWGYRVDEADGLAQAWQRLQAEPGQFAAVLVDQFMGTSSGWELLQKLRQDAVWAGLPVLLVSASDAQRPEGYSQEFNFDLVLGKPIDFERLAEFLCKALHPADCSVLEIASAKQALDGPVWKALPEIELQKFRQFLLMGRVLRIADWAQQLAAHDLQYRAFADHVVALVRAADLPALERLAVQLEISMPGSLAASN